MVNSNEYASLLSLALVGQFELIDHRSEQGKVGRVHLNSNGNMSAGRLNRLGETAYARTIERKLLRRLMPYA